MSVFMYTAREAWGLVTRHQKSVGIASVIGVGVITLCTTVADRVLASQARAREIRVQEAIPKLTRQVEEYIHQINEGRKSYAENPIFASAGFGYGQDLLKKQLDGDLTALNRMQSQYRFSIQEEALTSTSAIVAMLGISTVTSNYPELSLRVEKLSSYS